jgi:hypothetical protein
VEVLLASIKEVSALAGSVEAASSKNNIDAIRSAAMSVLSVDLFPEF